MYIGHKHEILIEVDSTNNYVAKRLEEGNYVEGSAILAHWQYHGRGQRGSQWQSEAGKNLTFSFAIRSSFLPLHRHFLLAKAVSVAVAGYLEDLLQDSAQIKWPNDILVGGKKIAGILIERKLSGEAFSVVGIGLNVNQTEFDPEYGASSVALELGRGLGLIEVYNGLCRNLNLWVNALKRSEHSFINQAYGDMLYGRAVWVHFVQQQRSFTGMVVDVDEQGMLLVKSRQGAAETFAPKEIQIKYPTLP